MNNCVFVFAMTTFVLFGVPVSMDVSVAQAAEPQEATVAGSADASLAVRFENEDKTVKVFLGDEHFTTFDYGSYDKPILYPILGPGQVGMTRNWPMKKDVEGEAHDHPHHKSMWISHEINGLDFWAESEGKVQTVGVTMGTRKQAANLFRARSQWIDKSNDKIVFTDQTAYRFGGDETSRWIDCTITYRANRGDVTFDDTKEGLFAIRTHPDLRLSPRPKDGVTEVFGKAVNSEGDSGKEIWGKQAKWLLYQGPIDGTPMSIAMYDHPENLRHPTTWHARDYGLVTANPFGLHHFLGKEKGEGAYTIKKGGTLTLRYRVEFIKGLAKPSDIEARFAAFSSTPVSRPKSVSQPISAK